MPPGVEDRIRGTLDANGNNPKSANGTVITGDFDEADLFTLVNRHFHERVV